MEKLRKLLFLLIVLFSLQSAKAQVQFNHSLGISALFSQNNGVWGFTYEPRINLVPIGEDANLSLGTHLTANISYSSSNSDGNGVLFDFPIVAEFNSGFGASKESNSSFGFFGGIGYDLVSTMADANGSNSANGLILDAGIRFSVKVPLSLRVSYLLSSKANDPNSSNVLSLGVSYMFGMADK